MNVRAHLLVPPHFFVSTAFKAVVKYVGGFWPIGVFFAGYGSFFFVPSRQTQTRARL